MPPTPLPGGVLLQPRGCFVCKSTVDLILCPMCNVVEYCKAHWEDGTEEDYDALHLDICAAVHSKRGDISLIERAFDDNTLINAVASAPFLPFWRALLFHLGIMEDYYDAKKNLIRALIATHTVHAIQEASAQVIQTMNIMDGDFVCLRYFGPGLFLRMGEDNLCYDFIKFCVRTSNNSFNNVYRANGPIPLLTEEHVRYENILEPVDFFLQHDRETLLEVSATLLKIKFILELKRVQSAMPNLKARLPPEMVDKVISSMVSPAIFNHGDRHDIFQQLQIDANPVINLLEGQVSLLFNHVRESNKWMWSAIVSPHLLGYDEPLVVEEAAKDDPELAEVQWVFENQLSIWMTIPGAVDMVRYYLDH
jgi:hypothetical protein